ncbi:transposase [Streptomyces sp. NPDC005820]|uniref:transposase n=1 Tax=Streptomyces sp. NPDC005820 TaxID=3157069 RepID=UPI00340FF6B3
MGRRRLPPTPRRARRRPRHRHGNHSTQARDQGVHPIPKRWVVERTYDWLMRHRRLARDYETRPARSEAMIHIAAERPLKGMYFQDDGGCAMGLSDVVINYIDYLDLDY